MVFPFKHPLGWFLLLAALGLVGCNDEATTPETLHTEPYRTPPVVCHEGKDSPIDITPDTPPNDSLPHLSPNESIYIMLVDKETNKPMSYDALDSLVPDSKWVDGVWSGGITTTVHAYPNSNIEYGVNVSMPEKRRDNLGVLLTEEFFTPSGDSLFYVNLHYYFQESKTERVRVVYYNKGYEPDSCYRLYYFHNDTLVYKGNDHHIHYPALHIDY
jgi:hypothetical protein